MQPRPCWQPLVLLRGLYYRLWICLCNRAVWRPRRARQWRWSLCPESRAYGIHHSALAWYGAVCRRARAHVLLRYGFLARRRVGWIARSSTLGGQDGCVRLEDVFLQYGPQPNGQTR